MRRPVNTAHSSQPRKLLACVMRSASTGRYFGDTCVPSSSYSALNYGEEGSIRAQSWDAQHPHRQGINMTRDNLQEKPRSRTFADHTEFPSGDKRNGRRGTQAILECFADAAITASSKHALNAFTTARVSFRTGTTGWTNTFTEAHMHKAVIVETTMH